MGPYFLLLTSPLQLFLVISVISWGMCLPLEHPQALWFLSHITQASSPRQTNFRWNSPRWVALGVVGNFITLLQYTHTHTHTCMMYFLVFTFYNFCTLVFVTIFRIHIHGSFIYIYMILCIFLRSYKCLPEF